MASSKNFCIIFFFLVLVPSLSHATPSLIPQLTSMKERACHATNSYRFCMKRLNRNPQATSASSALSLEKSIIHMGKVKAFRIQTAINMMHASNDPMLVAVKPALDVCANSYQTIVESLGKVEELELEEDLLSANYDIMVLFDEIGYCETALAQATARLPSMAIANRAMKHFISMAAAATNGLQ